MYKTSREYEKEARELNVTPEVRFVGEMGGYPLFQQEPPGVGSFMLMRGEASVAQAYERAQARYAKGDAIDTMFDDVRRHEMRERINGILQDGGEDMAPCDVLDCVFGSVSFTMNDADRKFVLKEVRAITGRT